LKKVIANKLSKGLFSCFIICWLFKL